jgi:hypothetical protein
MPAVIILQGCYFIDVNVPMNLIFSSGNPHRSMIFMNLGTSLLLSGHHVPRTMVIVRSSLSCLHQFGHDGLVRLIVA